MTLASPGRSLISHDSPMGAAGRKFFAVEPFDFASAPDAFLEDRPKSERIEHGDYAVAAARAMTLEAGLVAGLVSWAGDWGFSKN